MFGSTTLFAYAFRDQDLAKLQQPEMKKPLLKVIADLLGEGALDKIISSGYLDLTVTFVDPEAEEEGMADDQKKLLENVPVVRIILDPNGK
jgi:hypothetical protein